MRALLAQRDIRILLLAQVLSTLGDNSLWIALGIWIKMLTGSTSAAGLSFFAFTAGLVFAPLGGVVVDRTRRRPLLVVLNLAAAVLVLPLLLIGGRSEIWLIYVVMLGYGFLTGVIGSAQTALTQTLVPTEQLGNVNGLLQTLLQGLRLVSPLLGAGILTALGAAPLIIGDAVTFVLASLLLWLIRVAEVRPVREAERILPQLTVGIRYIAAAPVLRQLTVATMLAIVAFGFSESVLFAVVAQGVHRTPSFLGVLSSAEGIGAIAAGLAAGALTRRIGEPLLVSLGLAVAASGFLLMCASTVGVVVVGSVLTGASLPWIITGLMTTFQRGTPSELMGRTSTALGVLISAPQTVAIAVGAGLVAVVDYRILLMVMTGLLALSAGYLGMRQRQQAALPSVTA